MDEEEDDDEPQLDSDSENAASGAVLPSGGTRSRARRETKKPVPLVREGKES